MNTKFNLRRKICLSILTCVVIIFAGTTTHTVKAQTYDPYAVQVINNLIANNGLQAIPDAPETWMFATWNDEMPKQIIELILCYKNLTGIASFAGLTTLQRLDCFDNNLTGIDVTGCTALIEMNVSWNPLSKLDVTTCINLQILSCSCNGLTELDLSNSTQMKSLYCSNNMISELDVTNCTQLQRLGCSFNRLSKLDLKACTKLGVLYCSENHLTEIDLTGVKLGDIEACCQRVPLTLYKNQANEYTCDILLNKPYFDNGAISYSDGILKSTDSNVYSTSFSLQTIGNNSMIWGEMYFTYSNVGINTNEKMHLIIYPNPTTGELKISPLPLRDFPQRGKKMDVVNGELRIKSIEIFDINGRKQKAEGRKQKAGEMVIDMFHLPTGIYLLHIDTDKGEIIKKIVKQ